MTPIKVVIADDHALFRDGLKKILALEKDILVVGEAANGDEIPKVVDRAKPDILLLDVKMPKGDVVQTLLDVAARSPATRVIVLTAYSEEENILNAAKGGARGYVPKGVPSATLLQAIKVVQNGGCWIDKEMPAWETFEEIVQDQSGSLEAPRQFDESIKALTKREMEILRLVAEGLTNEAGVIEVGPGWPAGGGFRRPGLVRRGGQHRPHPAGGAGRLGALRADAAGVVA